MKFYIQIICIFCICVIFNSPTASAQAKLGIGVKGIINPDTFLNDGDETELKFFIVNKGNQNYNEDKIKVYRTINNEEEEDIFELDDQDAHILAGDSTFVVIHLNVATPTYSIGNNIVTIWPVGASGVVTVDSAQYSLYLYPFTAVANTFKTPKQPFLSIFNNTLQIINAPANIKYVQFYNGLGQKLNQFNSYNTPIVLNNFLKGMYFIEIQTNDNKKYILKFVL